MKEETVILFVENIPLEIHIDEHGEWEYIRTLDSAVNIHILLSKAVIDSISQQLDVIKKPKVRAA